MAFLRARLLSDATVGNPDNLQERRTARKPDPEASSELGALELNFGTFRHHGQEPLVRVTANNEWMRLAWPTYLQPR